MTPETFNATIILFFIFVYGVIILFFVYFVHILINFIYGNIDLEKYNIFMEISIWKNGTILCKIKTKIQKIYENIRIKQFIAILM